jgi:hypothetical protein
MPDADGEPLNKLLKAPLLGEDEVITGARAVRSAASFVAAADPPQRSSATYAATTPLLATIRQT